jgi:hypothetical protein
MPVAYAFWGLMLLWLVFGVGGRLRPELSKGWIGDAADVVVFVLLALVGWQLFGPALK